MDQSRLEHLYEILPLIREVTIYQKLQPTGRGGDVLTYDPDQPIRVGASERRNIERRDESLYGDMDGSLSRALFHLWPASFSASWQPGFTGYSVKIRAQWLLKEADGSEWLILNPQLEMANTRWRCPVIENLGERIIP